MREFSSSNKLMGKYLQKIRQVNDGSITGDISKIADIILSPVIEFKECFLLQSNINIDFLIRSTPDCIEDKEAFEYGENHIHVKDFLEERQSDIVHLLRIGIAVAEIFCLKLQRQFPSGQFAVIVSCDVLNDDPALQDCVVRFYKIRENGRSILDSNLDNYTREAVGQIFL